MMELNTWHISACSSILTSYSSVSNQLFLYYRLVYGSALVKEILFGVWVLELEVVWVVRDHHNGYDSCSRGMI